MIKRVSFESTTQQNKDNLKRILSELKFGEDSYVLIRIFKDKGLKGYSAQVVQGILRGHRILVLDNLARIMKDMINLEILDKGRS